MTQRQYATKAELKQWLADNTGNVPSDHDTGLDRALYAATRQIEEDTGRVFVLSSSEARTFYADAQGIVRFVDLVGSPTLVEYDSDWDDTVETTLASTDYMLLPKTGEAGMSPGSGNTIRYQSMTAKAYGNQAFYPGRPVRITGIWGYVDSDGNAPYSIIQACLILAARIYMRRMAVFGRITIPEAGMTETLPKIDPDYHSLIRPYVCDEKAWWIA